MWNQCWGANVGTESGVSYTKENGVYHVVKSTTANNGLMSRYRIEPNGHKYYVSFSGKSDNENVELCVSIGSAIILKLTNTMQRKAGIIATPTSGNARSMIYYYSSSGVECEYDCTEPIVVDLTAMFGAGNEPSTLDDPRIKWIEDYANEYPEYNIGELISYNGSGIKTVGFNQFDKDNPSPVIHGYIDSMSMSIVGAVNHSIYYIPCLPNTTYYASRKAISTNDRFGIADMNDVPEVGGTINGYSLAPYSQVVGNDMALTLTTGANAKYLAVWAHWVSETDGTEALDTICINFSWSGYRNGEYEPYWSRILNLPISTYFPDGMKSAGSVRDELTKDKAVKRIGVVVLNGSEPSWGKSSSALNGFYIPMNIGSWQSDGYMKGYAHVIALGYTYTSDISTYYNNYGYVYTDRTIAFNIDPAICGSTVEEFKSWLAQNPITVVYELAEPIETTITPLDLTYKVADFGTEESISEGKSTPFNGIIKYSDDFTRVLVNMPKNYDTTASLDALAASLSAMLTSALNGTVTITRGEYDQATKKYEWSCQFTENQVN